ncbi:MAG: metal-dependent transcriptional regulator [Chloroflexi bacterium]|nr:metal-dependent transcriptional regulator [Chloroflexota bacterium]
MQTPATENYLKAIYELQRDGRPRVEMSALAHHLGVAPASVTNMVQRLAAMHLLVYKPYKGVTLSTAGERHALDVLRRHEVVERYLVRVLGLSPVSAHETAEAWEHLLSEELERRMADMCRHSAH